MNLTDEERESLIGITGQLSQQGSPSVRYYWWDLMKTLIRDRSAGQIERMERERGLRAG